MRVNRRFADAVLEEIGDTRAIVFVQDYHFALLPRIVKEARPDVTVVPVLAHPVAEPRGVPRLPVGRGDPARPARQRSARRSTCSTTATTSSTPSIARSSRASTTSTSRSGAAAGRPSCGRFRSASTRRCGTGPSQGRRSQTRKCRRCASALGLERRAHRSSASIASTTPRAFPIGCGRSIACSSGIPSGAAASRWCRSARRAAITCQRYQALSDEVEALRRRRSTRATAPTTGSRSCIVREHHSPEDDRRAVSRRRRVRGVVAARRHEPGRQGVHRRRAATSRACWCCRSSPAPRASCDQRRARQSVRDRCVCRRAARRADDAAATSRAAACARCATRVGGHTVFDWAGVLLHGRLPRWSRRASTRRMTHRSRCITARSATAACSRWSVPTPASTGCACRASTARRCSRGCSTRSAAARGRSSRSRPGHAVSGLHPQHQRRPHRDHGRGRPLRDHRLRAARA